MQGPSASELHALDFQAHTLDPPLEKYAKATTSAARASSFFPRASAAQVGESNSRSNVFQIRRASVCVPSRWKVLSGEFRRRPTALAIKFRKSDRVGRRGLSEPREDFSRLITYAFL